MQSPICSESSLVVLAGHSRHCDLCRCCPAASWRPPAFTSISLGIDCATDGISVLSSSAVCLRERPSWVFPSLDHRRASSVLSPRRRYTLGAAAIAAVMCATDPQLPPVACGVRLAPCTGTRSSAHPHTNVPTSFVALAIPPDRIRRGGLERQQQPVVSDVCCSWGSTNTLHANAPVPPVAVMACGDGDRPGAAVGRQPSKIQGLPHRLATSATRCHEHNLVTARPLRIQSTCQLPPILAVPYCHVTIRCSPSSRGLPQGSQFCAYVPTSYPMPYSYQYFFGCW